jgi:hypothetical protein
LHPACGRNPGSDVLQELVEQISAANGAGEVGDFHALGMHIAGYNLKTGGLRGAGHAAGKLSV